MAQGFRSPLLAEMNANDIIDELRVIIYDRNCCSAYFTFSCQINPKQILFHIYGPQNSILVDHTHQIVIKMSNYRFKSYLNHFVPPLIFARQHAANARYNVKQFLRRNFHMATGMKRLIESFYLSILRNEAPPISYREILLTARIMDAIFDQISGEHK
jgi:hypothetical protein